MNCFDLRSGRTTTRTRCGRETTWRNLRSKMCENGSSISQQTVVCVCVYLYVCVMRMHMCMCVHGDICLLASRCLLARLFCAAMCATSCPRRYESLRATNNSSTSSTPPSNTVRWVIQLPQSVLNVLYAYMDVRNDCRVEYYFSKESLYYLCCCCCDYDYYYDYY